MVLTIQKHKSCIYIPLCLLRVATIRIVTPFLLKFITKSPSKMSVTAKKKRIVLNKETAIEIYQHKIRLMVPMSYKQCLQSWKESIRGESSKLAKQYGVSPKTVRDVWNRKSWTEVTMSLWNLEKNKVSATCHDVVEKDLRPFSRFLGSNSLFVQLF